MNWKPEDYIVAALSLLIIVGMFGRLYGVIILDKPVEGDALRLTENILSGVMAIISMYIGAKIQQKRDQDKDE